MRSVIPERRFVTVLFADIKGFTSLSENLDPEDVEDIINSIFQKFREVIESHGGYLDKFIGDAVMAVFGAPKSHSDDPRRAILSGLSMQKALYEFNKKHNLTLGLRVGINTGEVLWSSIAGEKATVMGDAVNVAQRLESIGEPGKVFVSGRTKELAQNDFEFESKGQTQVKGRKEPVDVYGVVREKEIEGVVGKGSILTPLFERDREIATLKNVLESTIQDRRFSMVLLRGDAGLGKTRLATEFLNIAAEQYPDVHKIVVRADPLKQGSYHVVSRIIMEKTKKTSPEELEKEVIATLSKMENLSDAEVRAFAGLVVSTVFPSKMIGGRAGVLKERINALITFFAAIFSASEYPIILMIDDFHHTDEDSINFVASLKSVIVGVPVMLIINSRREFKSLEPDVELVLSPVGKSSLYYFARFMFNAKDEKISPEFIDFVMEKTGGNPYYVEELLKYIRDKGLYRRNPLRAKADGLHLPETLKGILTEEIDALPPVHKETVKIAACIGRVFWKGVLEIVKGDSVEETLRVLKESGIIQVEERSLIDNDIEYSFLHELLSDAAYTLLTRKERIKLHNIIAGILELYENNATLLFDAAKHYDRAQSKERAEELFEKAGDLATNQANFSFALKCYSKIEEPGAPLLLKKAKVLETLSDYKGAVDAIKIALSMIDEDDELYTKLNIRFASVKEKQGDFSTALSVLKKITDPKSPILKADVLGRTAWILFRLAKYDEAKSRAKTALLIIERLNQSNEEVLLRKGLVLNTLANIRMRLGQMEEAFNHFQDAIEIYRSMNDKDRLSKILINTSTYLMSRGEFMDALSNLKEALELTTQTANRGLLPAIYNNIGLVYLSLNEIEKAIVDFRHALKISENLGMEYMIMNVLVNLGRAYSAMSLLDDALIYFERALRMARENKNIGVEGIVLINLAYVYYLKEDYENSEQNAREAMYLFKESDNIYAMFDIVPILSDVLIERMQYEEAVALVDEVVNLAMTKGVSVKTAPLLIKKTLSLFLRGDRENISYLIASIEFNDLDVAGKSLLLLMKRILNVGFTVQEKEELESNPEFKILFELFENIDNPSYIQTFLSNLPPSIKTIKQILRTLI